MLWGEEGRSAMDGYSATRLATGRYSATVRRSHADRAALPQTQQRHDTAIGVNTPNGFIPGDRSAAG
jgi:hypothetical protein